QPYLNLYSSASAGLPQTDLGNGTADVTLTASSPGSENYVMGRYDWTLSSNDSLFVRYLFDDATLNDAFYGAFPQWGSFDRTRNQFTTIGEKHILSQNVINSAQVGFTRTFFDIHSQSLTPASTPTSLLPGALNWSGDLWTHTGEPVMDGTLSPGSSI